MKVHESRAMHGAVIFRMKGKCTLLKSALSRQVLNSKFETQYAILESFENQELSL